MLKGWFSIILLYDSFSEGSLMYPFYQRPTVLIDVFLLKYKRFERLFISFFVISFRYALFWLFFYNFKTLNHSWWIEVKPSKLMKWVPEIVTFPLISFLLMIFVQFQKFESFLMDRSEARQVDEISTRGCDFAVDQLSFVKIRENSCGKNYELQTFFVCLSWWN